MYDANCSGISLEGLKWSRCAGRLGKEGRVNTVNRYLLPLPLDGQKSSFKGIHQFPMFLVKTGSEFPWNM